MAVLERETRLLSEQAAEDYEYEKVLTHSSPGGTGSCTAKSDIAQRPPQLPARLAESGARFAFQSERERFQAI